MSPNSSTHADRIACWLAVNPSVLGSPPGSRSLRQRRLADDAATRDAAVERAAAGVVAGGVCVDAPGTVNHMRIASAIQGGSRVVAVTTKIPCVTRNSHAPCPSLRLWSREEICYRVLAKA